MQKIITIATRESQLALWQANWVKQELEKNNPNLTVQLLKMTTQADRAPYISLQEIGGKGLFVKELEEALLRGDADLAVHSMKDMPIDLPQGLTLAAMSAREDPWDVFVSNHHAGIEDIAPFSVVGTSSLRRQSFLLHLRPDLKVMPLRGNVLTRLARLDSGEYAAIILAAAGLKRLGLEERLTKPLSTETFMPAAGQGVLGLECRSDDKAIQQLLAPLNDAEVNACVTAERALSRELGANCQVPVAAFASMHDKQIILSGMVGSLDGKQILRAQQTGESYAVEALGKSVGEALLAQGAGKILQAIIDGRT